MSRQMSLFDVDKPAPAPVTLDARYIRKSLNRLLRIVRNAEVMPWSEDEAASWEKAFKGVAPSLPDKEGEALYAAFAAELARLRAV